MEDNWSVEVGADTIVYYAYGPGSQRYARLREDVLLTLMRAEPGWQTIDSIAARLTTDASRRDLGAVLELLKIQEHVDTRGYGEEREYRLAV